MAFCLLSGMSVDMDASTPRISIIICMVYGYGNCTVIPREYTSSEIPYLILATGARRLPMPYIDHLVVRPTIYLVLGPARADLMKTDTLT